jgi:putative DNA primase/helicase
MSPDAPRQWATWQVVTPVPVDAPPPSFRHFCHVDAPDHVARYQRDGRLYGFVVRWRTSDGGKAVLPHTWCTSSAGGTSRWQWKHWSEPRPLYLPGGRSPRGRAVVLVEGEACADALHAALEVVAPGDYCVATWPGGAQAWRKADWAWLAGSSVLLWPDADAKREPLTREDRAACTEANPRSDAQQLLPPHKQPGMAAMLGIGQLLEQQHRCRVRLLPIPAPDEATDGWDCMDAIAEGWSGTHLLSFFRQARDLASPAGAGPRPTFVACTGHVQYLRDDGRRYWPLPAAATRPLRDADFSLVLTGNAFEAPPRIHHQRPRPRRGAPLLRCVRALLQWLLGPTAFPRRFRSW